MKEKIRKIGKLLLRWGLVLIVLTIAINMFTSKNTAKVSATGNDSGRKYAESYNFSDETGDFFTRKIKVPAGGKWASVKLPMGYDVDKAPHSPMTYDYCDGRPLVHDAPGKKLDSKNVPAAFDVTAEGAEGELEIRCYRIKSEPAVTKVKTVAMRSVKHERHQKRFVKAHTQYEDRATSVQML